MAPKWDDARVMQERYERAMSNARSLRAAHVILQEQHEEIVRETRDLRRRFSRLRQVPKE